MKKNLNYKSFAEIKGGFMFKRILKKIALGLTAILSIVIGFNIYNSFKTVECWWGTLYPTLSFVAIEDEEREQEVGKVSSIDEKYFPTIEKEEEPIKFKIAIWEWIKDLF